MSVFRSRETAEPVETAADEQPPQQSETDRDSPRDSDSEDDGVTERRLTVLSRRGMIQSFSTLIDIH